MHHFEIEHLALHDSGRGWLYKHEFNTACGLCINTLKQPKVCGSYLEWFENRQRGNVVQQCQECIKNKELVRLAEMEL